MTKTIVCTLLLALVLAAAAPMSQAFVPFKTQLKTLYADPNKDADVVFRFPIEVTMLGMTEDLNWFKVRIKFELAFIRYEYTGWVNIPVGSTFNLPPIDLKKVPL
ncbi:MAG: hypothetical protein WC901_06840 [Candidatus Margulisiibacteriota bacterium]